MKKIPMECGAFSVDSIERRSVDDALKDTRSNNAAALSIENKKHALWQPGSVLTYVFSAKNCTEVQFRTAYGKWTGACNIEFKKVADPALAVFEVKDFPRDGKTVAESFFPSYSKDLRILRIFEDLNQPPFKTHAVSILAHELGHILGFLHEHIWLTAKELHQNGVNPESTSNAMPVTDYDKDSIMNYLRIYGDMKSGDPDVSTLSELDTKGCAKCYPL